MLAIDTTVQVAPDKAFYHPGEAVVLTVSAAQGVQVEATVRYLDQIVTTLSAPIQNGAAALTWTPPAPSQRGYGVDVAVLDADGKIIATTATAFDVLDHWIQAPRYGFLSNFLPGRSDAEVTAAYDAKYHVNGLQFYDWQYRHEQLLPPQNAILDPTTESYNDVLDKLHSLTTVKQLIDAAHAHNIAAMPYTAIYGASYAFYNEHPDWALFDLSGKPFDFANFLKIMDPTPGSPWEQHLMAQFADVLKNTAFDGIHVDQYGAPMRGLNAAGQPVDLEQVFPGFIDQTAEVVHQYRGDDGVTIFNLVRNWPVRTVAPSDENVVYIEVWDPYRQFMDLAQIVSNAQALGGGKPVIIAAYVSPDWSANVQIMNALIFASGAYHLELGEPRAMLAHAYFPWFGVMNDTMLEIERRYYDFLVRYENVLALGTSDATQNRAKALTISGVKTSGYQSSNRVAVIVRQGQSSETFSLVNLMGLDGGYWDEALAHGPTPLRDLAVTLQVSKPVDKVWLASPDGSDPTAQAVNFQSDGSAIAFTVPQLDYWTMLVVEYKS
ncbi:MAG TPA: glycoside hydrolase family 66 protein [Phototrophicaceae bacterium]|nr:glycoside hydrolase family 66 protein [Phototrophicaceae bacterium]